MPYQKFCLGLLILLVVVGCGRPVSEPLSNRVDQALVERLRELPAAARGDYQEGFRNGTRMVHEALKAGVRPYRPVLDLPTAPSRFLGPVPEGVQVEATAFTPEVDRATGLLMCSANGAKTAFFAKGQVDGFDWALTAIGQSLVRPIPVIGLPSKWTSWKDHQGGETLDSGAWTARILWTPGQLAWSRKELGFPSQRSWRSWVDTEAPCWVALGEGALWLETNHGQVIALDPESGGILDIRPAVPHQPSRQESWESYNQDVIKEFHSPEFQRRLATLRKTAESGKIPDLMAVVDHLHGMGAEADREAYDWSLKAAEKGSPEAMLRVGVCLFHGQPVPSDKDAARRWLERAIQAGEPNGRAVLRMLFEGENAPQDAKATH